MCRDLPYAAPTVRREEKKWPARQRTAQQKRRPALGTPQAQGMHRIIRAQGPCPTGKPKDFLTCLHRAFPNSAPTNRFLVSEAGWRGLFVWFAVLWRGRRLFARCVEATSLASDRELATCSRDSYMSQRLLRPTPLAFSRSVAFSFLRTDIVLTAASRNKRLGNRRLTRVGHQPHRPAQINPTSGAF